MAARCRRGERRPVGLALENLRDRVRDRVTGKGDAPGQHLVEHAAERPDVGALVDRLPARLLAGSCRPPCRESRPACVPPIGSGPDAVGARRLRQPEVEHLHHAVRRDLDVRGLQVAVDDPFLVRGLERVGDLPRDRQRFVNRQP